MTVKELIIQLKTYDDNLSVAIMNLNDDSTEAGRALKAESIGKIEQFDEFKNKLTGGHFIAIFYQCSVCERREIEL